jgi:hypothetical protein
MAAESEVIKTFIQSFEQKLSSTYLIEEELALWENSIGALEITMPRIAKIDDRWRFPIAFDRFDNDFWYGGTALFYGFLDWQVDGLQTQINPSLGESGQYEGSVMGLASHEVNVSPWIPTRNQENGQRIDTYLFNFGGYEIPDDLRNCNFSAQFQQEVPDMYLNEFGVDSMQIVKDVFPKETNNPITLYIVEAISKGLGESILMHGLPSVVSSLNTVSSEIVAYKNKLRMAEGSIL